MNLLIATARSHFQAVTMTLAALGQLRTSPAATAALEAQANLLGLGGKIDPHIGATDHAKIHVDFGRIAGHFPVIYPTGGLGDFVSNRLKIRKSA